MDSDIETFLSRQVSDNTTTHFQIFPPMGGEGDTVLCPLFGVCPGLTQLYKTSPKEMLKQRLSLQPPCPLHIRKHLNVYTSCDPSLAHIQDTALFFFFFNNLCSTIPSHLLG